MEESRRVEPDGPAGRAVALCLLAAVVALGAGVAALIVGIVLVKGAL